MCRRLRDARKRSRLKQTEAAAALGKQQNFVSKCENAQRRIDAIELANFAALYGTTLDALVPSAPRGTKSKRVAEPTIKPKPKRKRRGGGKRHPPEQPES